MAKKKRLQPLMASEGTNTEKKKLSWVTLMKQSHHEVKTWE